MTVSSATLRKLAALNLDSDQMAGVLDLLADQQEAEEARLAAQRERKARQRAGQSRDSHGTNEGHGGGAPSAPEVSPQTPFPNPTNPIPPSPPKGGSSPTPETETALQAYTEMATASGLAVPRAITAGRKARLAAVLREHGLAVWVEAVGKVGASSFCRGENDRGWKADLDFLLQPKSFPKILEGHYDDRMPRAGPQQLPMDNLINSLLTEMEMADASASAEIEGYSAAPCQLPGPAR